MRPSEASVSIQTGLTLFSGPSALVRMFLPFSIFFLSISYFLIFSHFSLMGSLPFTTEESGEAMDAKLGMTMAACKY